MTTFLLWVWNANPLVISLIILALVLGVVIPALMEIVPVVVFFVAHLFRGDLSLAEPMLREEVEDLAPVVSMDKNRPAS